MVLNLYRHPLKGINLLAVPNQRHAAWKPAIHAGMKPSEIGVRILQIRTDNEILDPD
jgi:hypothetical protein